MTEARPDSQEYKPENYYDVLSGYQLIGKAAVDSYIESGGHPCDVEELGPLLSSDEPIVTRSDDYRVFAQWSDEEIVQSMRWLNSVLPKPSNRYEYRLDSRIITRANYLGLTASVGQIKHASRFNAMTNLYRLIGEDKTLRKFPEIDRKWVMDYLSNLASELGHFPSDRELNDIGRVDPSKPKHETITRLLQRGLGGAARELGFIAVRREGIQTYRDWGSDFVTANQGILPTEYHLGLYSPLSRSPAHSPTHKRFQTYANYHQAIKQNQIDDLETLFSKLDEGSIPWDLLDRSSYGGEIVGRCVRYVAAKELVSNLTERKLYQIACSSTTQPEFIAVLQTYSPNINFDDVEDVTAVFGVYKNMWRPEYIRSLRIESVVGEYLERHRGALTAEEKEAFDSGVLGGIDYLDSKGGNLLYDRHINELNENGIIPIGDDFERLFVDPILYRLLAKTGIHRRRHLAHLTSQGIPEIIQEGVRTRNLSNDAVLETLYADRTEFVADTPENPSLNEDDDTQSSDFVFPPDFLESIRELEERLANPPPIHEIIRQLRGEDS